MKFLDRVTITGADDQVDPKELMRLSREFPFVEWGILVSKTSAGKPRYPSEVWLRNLVEHCRQERRKPWLSMHMCGRWTRDFCKGDLTDFCSVMSQYLSFFDRCQINWSPYFNDLDLEAVKDAIAVCYPTIQPIFQMGKDVNQEKWAVLVRWMQKNMIPFSVLQDASGGRGDLPERWEKISEVYTGFAGGLSPTNLPEQLGKIGEILNEGDRCWVDVESGVRKDNSFILSYVVDFLKIAEPYWVGG